MEDSVSRIRDDLYRKTNGQKRWGRAVIGLGVLTLLDMWTYVPIPLVGAPAVVVGAILIYSGLFLLWRAQELPIAETLEIAALHQGFLSGPLLIRALHVTPETAESILAELVRRGYARIEEQALEEGEVGYRVLGLSAPAPPAALPPDGSPSL